uniref:DNA replication factor Cdt1 C-terminal domain-containing protein n=1 Tax=Rhizophagus irregularis (strain DAOM 181602 / DAOM 197198 / MUCL 43194) TaxID=747089 RepID=U9TU11_RHIID
MGKIKTEKSHIVSSFFTSTKARTRSQKDETSKVRLTKDEISKVRLTKDETSKVRLTKDETSRARLTKDEMSRTKDEKSKDRLIKDKIFKENKPVKRAPIIKPKKRADTAHRRRALIERVRAKGQKTIEETLEGAELLKKKQKTMLSRAREIASSLTFIYISNNRTVMSVKEAATRIAESSKIPISEYEAVEHFKLLTKIAPEWCQFSTNKIKMIY